jgi:hypothetical protein
MKEIASPKRRPPGVIKPVIAPTIPAVRICIAMPDKVTIPGPSRTIRAPYECDANRFRMDHQGCPTSGELSASQTTMSTPPITPISIPAKMFNVFFVIQSGRAASIDTAYTSTVHFDHRHNPK